MTEPRDTTLADAIDEAQRKARDDERWLAHLQLHELAAKLRYEDVTLRWEHHAAIHAEQDQSVVTALDAVTREQKTHVIAHEAAHAAHGREHTLVEKATDAATASHDKEHALEKDARDKAENAIDKRLEGMNEVRSQLKEQALTFARVEVVNSLTDRIIAIEKLDIKGEGRALGQGAVVALIVGAVSFVGAILGIVIVVANFVSAT
jgi:hypothetical protein